MNILVIGFGNMGCRHAQSFLSNKDNKIFIIELDDNIFKNNSLRIGAVEEDLERISFQDLGNKKIDFAVIATSADIRFKLFVQVLEAGIKYILLEKVVFQSISQFENALKLIEKYQAKVYCNFLNRYSQSYTEIKKAITVGSRLNFTVTGGHFGFACNALHYIDLFKFLTNENVYLENSNLVKSDSPNIRGAKYVEVFGQQIWKNKKGDQLFISSDKENNSGKGSENNIRVGEMLYIINENTLNQYSVNGNGEVEVSKFDMPMASKLTCTLLKQIVDGNILLPSVEETMDYHIQFFESVNSSLRISKNELCPIT